MIQGIRKRFIRIAVAMLSVVMIALTVVINAVNYVQVRSELEETLMNLTEQALNTPKGRSPRNRRQQNALDEARYLTAEMSEDGRISISGRFRMSDDTQDEQLVDVWKVFESGRTNGRTGKYLYAVVKRKTPRNTTVNVAVLLNCETKMDGVHRLMLISCISCAGGIILAWFGMSLISFRAIRPMIKNAIQQKQFITDAGHELKTPLTVISANMDVLAMNDESNEWIEDTRKQVANMRGLINNMIYLSRLDEDGTVLKKETVDMSGIVRTQAESFEGMADFMGKTLTCSVQDGIFLEGEAESLTRLVSQLCDNAVRYAPDGDTLSINLTQSGREITLTSENGLTELLSQENLEHLFDRFYRPDASRSRENGGSGIGLSMARAVMERHGGKIRAEQTESGRIRFICTFPARKGSR